jgi:pimeloyl-ACP methyl ester carboxylesterase
MENSLSPTCLMSVCKLHKEDDDPAIPGYFFMSTAPINVEDPPREIQPCFNPDEIVDEIAALIAQQPDNAEIIIAIHGYNTQEDDAQKWCKEIHEYVNSGGANKKQKGTVFLGYNWPSEKVAFESILQKVVNEFSALPILLDQISGWGAFLIIIYSALSLFSILYLLTPSIGFSDWIFRLAAFSILVFFIVLVMIVGAVVGTVAFRIIAYSRDSYRATSFGVPDLVELIRHLDYEILKRSPELKNKKVRLSFIGHSMGGFVVTNVVRILSDVFDQASIEPLCRDTDISEKDLSPIGNVFTLERLVLVSPDIPMESILPGRSNFLRSSLRRFKESYLFSNEGDMILRVASTAANYISFAARTPDRSFRLGNATLNHSTKGGVLNLSEDGKPISNYSFLENLFISSDNKQKSLREVIDSSNEEQKLIAQVEAIPIAEFFTYFDCTSYSENGYSYLSNSNTLSQKTLGFWDCFCLIIDYLRKKIDVHGGYFEGDFGKKSIYGLAFSGLERLLDSFNSSDPNISCSKEDKIAMLSELSKQCEEKGIRVLISPRQYKSLERNRVCSKVVNQN